MSNKKSYVAPFDMFGGQVKKGDVYVRSQSIEPYYAFEAKPGILYFHLPAEIVETWEVKKTEAEEQAEMWEELYDAIPEVENTWDWVKTQNKFKLVRI